MNEPTISDLKQCASDLATACDAGKITDIERLLGRVGFIQTRLVMGGTLQREAIGDSEIALVNDLYA